jgi:hypothetical protein
MDVTWFRPHRHNWTLWERTTDTILPLSRPMQERHCETCGWTQQARVDMATPKGQPTQAPRPMPTRPNSPKVAERGKPEPMQWVE